MSEMLIKKQYLAPVLLNKVLTELEEDFKRTGSTSAEIICELNAICGDSVVVRACEYLDNNRLVRYSTSTDTRCVYKLTGNTKTRTILPDVNFCTCEYYARQVLVAQRALLCKHVLAVRIAGATGRARTEHVTDAQLADLLDVQFALPTDRPAT